MIRPKTAQPPCIDAVMKIVLSAELKIRAAVEACRTLNRLLSENEWI